jgi:hypothetical protein
MALTHRACRLIGQEEIMTPNSSSSHRPARPQPSPQQLVTRYNAVMFYSVAAAALLEWSVAGRADGLLATLGHDEAMCGWIERVWLPAKRAHAERARVYLERIWPEFEWAAACDGLSADCRRLTRMFLAQAGLAQAALACSAAAAQAAMFYRGLASAADDPELRGLLRDMGADETAHFETFRRCYERHRQHERLGMLASYRIIVSCAYRARDIDVQLAFAQLNQSHWFGSAPFPELTYPEFVLRLAAVLRRKLPLGAAQRFLLRPWFSARNVAMRATCPPAPASRLDASRLAA